MARTILLIQSDHLDKMLARKRRTKPIFGVSLAARDDGSFIKSYRTARGYPLQAVGDGFQKWA